MSRTGTRIGTIAAAAGGLFAAFLALSPTAAADPAVPAIPGMPSIDLMSQLSNAPAMASQFLQSAASMLQPAATPAAPAAAAAAPAAVPPPTATASLNLPQSLPAATAPLTQAVGTVPAGQPAAAAAPSAVPMLNQLPLPGNIAAIAQGIPGLGTNAAIPSITAPMSNGPMTPPAPGAAALPPALNPFSALP
jgi:hypothetical protein